MKEYGYDSEGNKTGNWIKVHSLEMPNKVLEEFTKNFPFTAKSLSLFLEGRTKSRNEFNMLEAFEAGWRAREKIG